MVPSESPQVTIHIMITHLTKFEEDLRGLRFVVKQARPKMPNIFSSITSWTESDPRTNSYQCTWF